METKKAVCMWCKGECGVLVKVQDGKLLGIEKDPEFPERDVFPKIESCPRKLRATEYVYHPERLRYPMKRVGAKGKGRWSVIGWEQALDEIAEKLIEIKKNYGAEALSVYNGTHRTHREYQMRFLNNFGSPNRCGVGNICALPRRELSYALIGSFPFYSVRPGKTKCIVLLGIEPNPARPVTYNKIRQAIKDGAKLIVIDPRQTSSASKADIWLPLRPGTDPALLLGMINMVIQEGLYDHDFVEKWCHGFNEVAERAKEYSLERVSKITGIPAGDIRKATLMYIKNKPASICEGMGIEEARNCSYSMHARWILAALAGNIAIEGGEELRVQGMKDIISNSEISMGNALSVEQKRKQLGAQFRLFSYDAQNIIKQAMERTWGEKARGRGGTISHSPIVWQAITSGQPYPVKALLVTAGNPMVTAPNTWMVYEALNSPNIELLVVMDFFKTPTAVLADYVLPAACWLERPSLTFPHSDQPYMSAGIAALPHCIPGEFDYKRDFDLYRELGLRLGQEDVWPWKTLEESYDYRVQPAGFNSFNEFVEKVRCYIPPPEYKKYEQTGFGTPTGKVELYSTIFEAMGYDPLPKHVEPHETPISCPEIVKDYPLTLLTGGRTKEYYHSEWRQIWSLREKYPYPVLQIHPDTAKALNISNEDKVWVESRKGKVWAIANLFKGIDPTVVHMEHGWWLPELPGELPWLHGALEVNCNLLGDDAPEHCDPITGGWGLKTILCKVYKARTIRSQLKTL